MHLQLMCLRQLLAYGRGLDPRDGWIYDNFRPTQPLRGREIREGTI